MDYFGSLGIERFSRPLVSNVVSTGCFLGLGTTKVNANNGVLKYEPCTEIGTGGFSAVGANFLHVSKNNQTMAILEGPKCPSDEGEP